MTPVFYGFGVVGSDRKTQQRLLPCGKPDHSRADSLLVKRGLAASRDRARALIESSAVLLAGRPLKKPSQLLAVDAELELTTGDFPWVSRGALKLIGGLNAFAQIDPADCDCLDIGASTGGFTEILLARGAKSVVALDVGRNQLHPSLSCDPRVVVLDGLNARDLTQEILGIKPNFIVCDASFISLIKLLPAALALASPRASLLALIKPQFEVGKGKVGKGGVVRNSALHVQTIARIERWLVTDMGWNHIGTVPSPIDGGDGNREFLIAARKP